MGFPLQLKESNTELWRLRERNDILFLESGCIVYSHWEFDFASVMGTEHQFTEMGICCVEQLQIEDLDVAKNFCLTFQV